MIHVASATIVVYGDLTCPWTTLAVHRLHQTRSRLGFDDRLRLDLRAFPLELFNDRPTPRLIVDAEVPVVGARAPEFGWQVWRADPFTYPGTVLLALEAVQAAKEQSLLASEELDFALRHAFFAQSRPIGLHHVIREAAESCPHLDVGNVLRALEDGRARRRVFEQKATAEKEGVQGSPHLFLPDGTDAHNPGIRMHWEGPKPGGFPVIDADDPAVYEDLVRRAVG